MNKQRGIFLLLMVALLGSCSGGGELQFTNGAVLSFSTTDFGERSFGTVSNLTVTVSNLGSRSASGLSTFAPTSPFGFAGGSFPGTGGTCVNSLGRGAGCTLVLSYTAPAPPVVNDSQTVLLTYSNGIGNPSVSVTLKAQANNGSFNQARGFNFAVGAVAAFSGGLWVGGTFESFSSHLARRIARFDSNASFDTSFNSAAGTSAGFDGQARSFAQAQDGSGDVYVGGDFTSYNSTPVANRIARLNSDGSLDTSFATGLGFDSTVFTVATAIDGSGDLYVGGSFTTYGITPSVNRIVRLNSDGSIDPTFGTGLGFDGAVNSIVLATDGSGDVYVGGNFSIYKLLGVPNYIIRINSDGSPDLGFVAGTGFGGGTVTSFATAMDGSGDIYVGGTFTSYNGTPSVNSIVRLNSDGSIDAGFNTGVGFVGGIVDSLAASTNGSGDIYVGGNFSIYNGTSDTNHIARLNSDGSLDTGFNTGSGTSAGFSARVYSLALPLDGSGDVYVGGLFIRYQGNPRIRYLVRLNSDGSVDTGANGSLDAPMGLSNTANSVSPAADGSGDVYVGGLFTTYKDASATKGIIRLNSDGSIDTGFNTGSGATAGFNTVVNCISQAEDNSGDLYVGGIFTSYNGTGAFRIARLNQDGSIDTAFAAGTGFSNQVFSIAPAKDGSGGVYVGGNFLQYQSVGGFSRIARLNSDGTPDPGFVTGTGFDNVVNAIAPATDGSGDVYVGGNFTNYNGTASLGRMIRLNSDGSIDTSFVTGSGFDVVVKSIVLAADGSGDVYVGGNFTSYSGTNGLNRITRLNSDGSIDAAFVTGSGFDAVVNSIAATSDGSGDVLIGGVFSAYKGSTTGRIARLNSDGSLDASFNPGSGPSSGFNSTVNSVAQALDGSGDAYVGGQFSSYSGVTLGNIARLSATGSSD